jgi:hypothetical protein
MVDWYKFHAHYSLAVPTHGLHIKRSNCTTLESNPAIHNSPLSHYPPRIPDLHTPLQIIHEIYLLGLTSRGPLWARIFVTAYYSVHPRKRRVVLSQLPHVLWASGCWHYERTLYSRRPLIWDRSFYLSIYLSGICG